MSSQPLAHRLPPRTRGRVTPRRLAVVRALLALAWAAGLALAVGDGAPTTASTVPLVAALLLATYPLIDVVASLLAADGPDDARGLRVSAGLSALGAVAVAATALGGDAGAALVAFGAWAAASGLAQLAVTLRRRHADGLPLPLIVSGGLSTLAGLGFASMAGAQDAHLARLAGYMAFGAALFLLWAARARTRAAA